MRVWGRLTCFWSLKWTLEELQFWHLSTGFLELPGGHHLVCHHECLSWHSVVVRLPVFKRPKYMSSLWCKKSMRLFLCYFLVHLEFFDKSHIHPLMIDWAYHHVCVLNCQLSVWQNLLHLNQKYYAIFSGSCLNPNNFQMTKTGCDDMLPVPLSGHLLLCIYYFKTGTLNFMVAFCHTIQH